MFKWSFAATNGIRLEMEGYEGRDVIVSIVEQKNLNLTKKSEYC